MLCNASVERVCCTDSYTVTLHAHTQGMYVVHNNFFITQVGLAVGTTQKDLKNATFKNKELQVWIFVYYFNAIVT